MPPLMLTDDEAVAVLLGLVGTRRAALQQDTAVAVESATAKLRRARSTAAATLSSVTPATADKCPSAGSLAEVTRSPSCRQVRNRPGKAAAAAAPNPSCIR
jgi:predicted DNA-binding transcriptional regulator YafY